MIKPAKPLYFDIVEGKSLQDGKYHRYSGKGEIMRNVINGLIGLAVIAFLLAVITVLTHNQFIMGIQAESFSRASTNLALIAIAMSVCCPKKSTG